MTHTLRKRIEFTTLPNAFASNRNDRNSNSVRRVLFLRTIHTFTKEIKKKIEKKEKGRSKLKKKGQKFALMNESEKHIQNIINDKREYER